MMMMMIMIMIIIIIIIVTDVCGSRIFELSRIVAQFAGSGRMNARFFFKLWSLPPPWRNKGGLTFDLYFDIAFRPEECRPYKF